MNIKDFPKKKWFIILGLIGTIISIIGYFFPFTSSSNNGSTNNGVINSQKGNNNVMINSAFSGSNINVDNRIINYPEKDNSATNDIRATRYSPKSGTLKYKNDSDKNIKEIKGYVYFRKENGGIVEMQNIDLGNINSKDEKELSLFCNPKLPMIVGAPGNMYKELEVVCFEYEYDGNYYSTVNYHDKLSYDFNEYKTYNEKCLNDDYYQKIKNDITESGVATNMDIDNLPPGFKELMLENVSKCEN